MRRLAALALAATVAFTASPALGQGQSELAETRQGTARFHKVGHAEAAGYGSTLDLLGCFEKPGQGGMGLHYLNGALLDGTVDAAEPEALVYEMREDGKLNLVGLEYLVPEALVDSENPPELLGHQLHPHGVLPFWILHVWIWRPNPSGMFSDYNPAVAMCPEGVPVFGS
ncbi:MAG TPA: hypothetical protein VF148_09940 [Acidimicrobiia bacterium]